MGALWLGPVPSRRRVEEVCGVWSHQEIGLVVGSPGRATGDITFVEDAGVEREGCLACFLGHLVQKGVIDNGGVVVHPVHDIPEIADSRAGRLPPRGERRNSLGPPGDKRGHFCPKITVERAFQVNVVRRLDRLAALTHVALLGAAAAKKKASS